MMLSCFLRIKGISLIINKCVLTLVLKVTLSMILQSLKVMYHLFTFTIVILYKTFSLLETNIPNLQNTSILSVTNFAQYFPDVLD